MAAKRTLGEPVVANGHAHTSSHARSKRARTISHTPNETIPQSLANALYAESNVLKIWTVARKALGSVHPPTLFPEYTGRDKTYVYRALDFWTSGFFPGSLYLLLERQILYPAFYNRDSGTPLPHRLLLLHLCQWWTANLHQNAAKRDTHDVGFMIAPWAIKAWELYRDPQSFGSLVLAAHSLASRFDERVQSLRSWDVCHTKRYSFADPSTDFLVIIDNMLNLDLLFWVARDTGDASLYDIAVAHARTTQKHHIRADKSTCHVVNYHSDGRVKAKFTHQGYSDDSCWSRGQSWGMLGFMQTYEWTKDESFLQTARELSDYFLEHLPEDAVPYWDFDAPVDASCPRDTSAGMVACCGLVLLYKALKDTDGKAARHYLESALRILDGTVSKFINPSPARFDVDQTGTDLPTFPDNEPAKQPGILTVPAKEGIKGASTTLSKCPDTILDAATVCNYEFASRRWADHGLVYADYYFLLLGNMLLDLGLVSR
ncbi:glycoside hydrolase family 88 protein [Aspergillus lucknowensis]|uniref:Six-hairpin glycosidase-like protein n=1 Tax=Aspergillus lucknowensis TaxID=176173 RepID=A0ABR4LKQ0_9EURO